LSELDDPRVGNQPSKDQRGRYRLPPEWVRAEAVINAGLIVIGIYLVQSFLALSVADVAARISILAWALAIPLLAILAMLNVAQESYRYAPIPMYFLVARAFAQGSAVVGVVAAFWHIWLPAAIVLIVSGLFALGLYATYSRRIMRDNIPN
jgi:hypothetical protein